MSQIDSLQGLCDRVMLWAVTCLLVAPPLLIGGVHYWSRALIQLLAAAVVALWCTRVLFARPAPMPAVTLTSPVRWGIVLMALLLLPLLPLPAAVLRWIAPRAFDVYAMALPGWPDHAPFADLFAALGRQAPAVSAGNLLFPPSWRPLSLVPYGTWMTLMTGLSYLVLAAVVAWYPWEDEMRALRWLVAALTAVAVAEALYAFVQQSTGGGRIFWLACPPHASCAGTYLNRDHYAGLLEMVFPFAVAQTMAGSTRRWAARGREATSWRRRLAQALDQVSEPAVGRALSLWCIALL
ncbi:MAG: hypothetical protein ACHQ4J_14185, partial [Candidatus Binatia bacterium]